MNSIYELYQRLNEFNVSDIRMNFSDGTTIVIQRWGPKFVVIGLGYECVVQSIESLISLLKAYNVPYKTAT